MFEKGKKYQCILSKSPGYKVGEIFECMQDEDGKLYLMGRDGFKDYTKDLLSGFQVCCANEPKVPRQRRVEN